MFARTPDWWRLDLPGVSAEKAAEEAGKARQSNGPMKPTKAEAGFFVGNSASSFSLAKKHGFGTFETVKTFCFFQVLRAPGSD